MPRPRLRLLPASLVAAAFAVLALPLLAAAAPPVIQTFHDEGSFAFAGPCPNGVTLVATFTEDVRVTTFFDEAGDPVREQIKVDFVGVVTNPATGESAENPSHHTIIVDLVEGTVTEVGLVFKATVPGEGAVILDLGRVVFDAAGDVIFEAGPHDVLNTAGPHPVRALYCAALT